MKSSKVAGRTASSFPRQDCIINKTCQQRFYQQCWPQQQLDGDEKAFDTNSSFSVLIRTLIVWGHIFWSVLTLAESSTEWNFSLGFLLFIYMYFMHNTYSTFPSIAAAIFLGSYTAGASLKSLQPDSETSNSPLIHWILCLNSDISSSHASISALYSKHMTTSLLMICHGSLNEVIKLI